MTDIFGTLFVLLVAVIMGCVIESVNAWGIVMVTTFALTAFLMLLLLCKPPGGIKEPQSDE